jgi:hypothetical protein
MSAMCELQITNNRKQHHHSNRTIKAKGNQVTKHHSNMTIKTKGNQAAKTTQLKQNQTEYIKAPFHHQRQTCLAISTSPSEFCL